MEGVKWISVEDKFPKEEDGLIIAYMNGYYEIVYFSTEEDDFKKPWRYDEFDTCIVKKKSISHWCKLNEPINEELV